MNHTVNLPQLSWNGSNARKLNVVFDHISGAGFGWKFNINVDIGMGIIIDATLDIVFDIMFGTTFDAVFINLLDTWVDRSWLRGKR